MNEFYLPNICYNNRRDTQKLCLAYTKDTLNKIIIIIILITTIIIIIIKN